MKTAAKLLLAVALLGVAVVLYLKLSPDTESQDKNAYFYDLEQRQLFVAPRNSVPPINGIKGATAAGVRAIVISATGDPGDKKHRQIAYLEKYSPEIKATFEAVQQARAAGREPTVSIDRRQVPPNTWVRRLQDTNWYAINSEEGQKITTEWNTPGPDGKPPVVCSP